MAPTECTVQISGNDLQVIYQALDELPGKISRPVYQRLSAQVQRVLEEHQSAEAEAMREAREAARERIIAEHEAKRAVDAVDAR